MKTRKNKPALYIATGNDLSEQLLLSFKSICAKRGTSMTAVIAEFMESYVEKHLFPSEDNKDIALDEEEDLYF